MNTHFSISNNVVHLWHALLSDFADQERDLLTLLCPDEIQRANRFHFPIHRQRFIIARGLLRKTLGLYINISPEKIAFVYGPRGKPYLQDNISQLQFNVSHSHDRVIYALTTHKEIGVDIEKIEADFKESVAKHFFSEQENAQLMQLPEIERTPAFYRIWSRKEAVIKLLGQGVYMSLDQFTVSSELDKQFVLIDNTRFLVQHIDVQSNYQAAFSISAPVTNILHWRWTKQGPSKSFL